MGPDVDSVESVENAEAAGVAAVAEGLESPRGFAASVDEGGDQLGIGGLGCDARDPRTCRSGTIPLAPPQLHDEPLPLSVSSWSLSEWMVATLLLNSVRFGSAGPAGGGTDDSSALVDASVELLDSEPDDIEDAES